MEPPVITQEWLNVHNEINRYCEDQLCEGCFFSGKCPSGKTGDGTIKKLQKIVDANKVFDKQAVTDKLTQEDKKLKLILKDRQRGKTYDLVQILKRARVDPALAHTNPYLLIVNSHRRKLHLLDGEYGLVENEVMEYEEYINNAGIIKRKILLDDADLLLKSIFQGKLSVISLTLEEALDDKSDSIGKPTDKKLSDYTIGEIMQICTEDRRLHKCKGCPGSLQDINCAFSQDINYNVPGARWKLKPIEYPCLICDRKCITNIDNKISLIQFICDECRREIIKNKDSGVKVWCEKCEYPLIRISLFSTSDTLKYICNHCKHVTEVAIGERVIVQGHGDTNG